MSWWTLQLFLGGAINGYLVYRGAILPICGRAYLNTEMPEGSVLTCNASHAARVAFAQHARLAAQS